MKRIQKCMRRKIAYANKMGTKPDVVGEQYIEFPRALCNINAKDKRVLSPKLILPGKIPGM